MCISGDEGVRGVGGHSIDGRTIASSPSALLAHWITSHGTDCAHQTQLWSLCCLIHTHFHTIGMIISYYVQNIVWPVIKWIFYLSDVVGVRSGDWFEWGYANGIWMGGRRNADIATAGAGQDHLSAVFCHCLRSAPTRVYTCPSSEHAQPATWCCFRQITNHLPGTQNQSKTLLTVLISVCIAEYLLKMSVSI